MRVYTAIFAAETVALVMIYVPSTATEEQVLGIVQSWVDLLAAEDYEAASQAINVPSASENWSAKFIKSGIKDYRSPKLYPDAEEFQVTDWLTAHGGNPNAERQVDWYHAETFCLAGCISYDLPLNGQWSDLRAEFVLWKGDTEADDYLLALEELESQKQHDAQATME